MRQHIVVAVAVTVVFAVSVTLVALGTLRARAHSTPSDTHTISTLLQEVRRTHDDVAAGIAAFVASTATDEQKDASVIASLQDSLASIANTVQRPPPLQDVDTTAHSALQDGLAALDPKQRIHPTEACVQFVMESIGTHPWLGVDLESPEGRNASREDLAAGGVALRVRFTEWAGGCLVFGGKDCVSHLKTHVDGVFGAGEHVVSVRATEVKVVLAARAVMNKIATFAFTLPRGCVRPYEFGRARYTRRRPSWVRTEKTLAWFVPETLRLDVSRKANTQKG